MPDSDSDDRRPDPIESRPTTPPEPFDRPALVVPRLQRTAAHRRFARDNPHLDAVLLSVEDARRFVEAGETAASAFPDTAVAVTTTVSDETLERWHPDREVALARAFAPDVYLPCDRPVYATDLRAERRDTLDRYRRDLATVAHRLADDRVTIVPLVKGVDTTERRRCYRWFDALGLDHWAYYCVQYFSYGNYRRRLVRDVHAIAREGTPAGLFLVGLQSPRYLRQMPPAVTAAAGLRWIDASGLRNDATTAREVRAAFGAWTSRVEAALRGGQVPLADYLDATADANSEVTAGGD